MTARLRSLCLPSIEKSVDENLEGQANGVEKVMGRVLVEGPAQLQDELREHQELREQADFLQLCDLLLTGEILVVASVRPISA